MDKDDVAWEQSVDIPLVDGERSCQAAMAAIDRMERLALELRKKACCDQVARFFEDRPGQEPIHVGWGQVGSGRRFLQGFLPSKHYTTNACMELVAILKPWAEPSSELSSLKLPPLDASNALREVGHWLLGQEVFEAWRAQVERHKLSQVARAGQRESPKPRL